MLPEQPPIPCARYRNRDSPSKDVWPKRDALHLNRAGDGEAIQSQLRPISNAQSCDQSRGHTIDRARVRVDSMREQKMGRAEVLVRANESPRKVRYRRRKLHPPQAHVPVGTDHRRPNRWWVFVRWRLFRWERVSI